ncbi:hypothetical protein QJS66_13215 [Kocuria rhizophila]|nr:hypothetical protein QJS66_13215 [Kocuria rhizophila]
MSRNRCSSSRDQPEPAGAAESPSCEQGEQSSSTWADYHVVSEPELHDQRGQLRAGAGRGGGGHQDRRDEGRRPRPPGGRRGCGVSRRSRRTSPRCWARRRSSAWSWPGWCCSSCCGPRAGRAPCSQHCWAWPWPPASRSRSPVRWT